MSLLFSRLPTADARCSLKTNDSGGPDVVLIGRNIYNILSSSSTSNRICISTTLSSKQSGKKTPCLQQIVSWAITSDQVETDSVVIPQIWMNHYGHIFHQRFTYFLTDSKPLSASLVEPILLTEIVVSALSKEAYEAACGNNSVLDEWFHESQPILRWGDTHTMTNGHNQTSTLEYRLDMLEPVLQGYASKGKTRLIVTLSENAENLVDEWGTDDETDGIEINEGFLASSILPQSSNGPNASHSSGLKRPSSNGIINGSTPTSGIINGSTPTSTGFTTVPLNLPVSITDDHCTLYLRMSDLSRLGILNGDWGVASYATAAKYRLVRVVADDNLVTKSGVVAGSPELLHNLMSISDSVENYTFPITLRSGLFGSHQPVIPTARTVTIARIASPMSINRTYQQSFLTSLKSSLNSVKRLFKQGDIIAVSMDTDKSRLTYDTSSGDDTGESIEADDWNSHYPDIPARANEVVYFIITNIEHDVVTNGTSSTEDVYVGSTTGELGCWIDPSVTRIIQTGVEHARVPDVSSYLGLDTGSSKTVFTTLRERPYSHLLAPDSPYQKMLSISSAGLSRNAVLYNLHLSMLLKGSRGTGKFTTISWVAQQLGLHLLEVNCFDVVGENKAKTEGTLRVRFEQARSCSPCVLVLRGIEAFSQTTQALEPNKEPAITNVIRECIEDIQQTWKITGYPVVVVGTTSESGRVPPGIISSFKHEVAFEAPNEGMRHEILDCLLRDAHLAADVSLSILATQTAALVAADLVDLVSRAKANSIERATRVTHHNEANLVRATIPLTAADFDSALGKARASYSESIGAPKIPNVSWDDVGGLAHVKSDILDTIQLPLDHPELFADGLKKRSGILLYGPPGTGKTLVAKAVATSCSLNFFSVKGPELLNMYIGESEANVRRVFQRARDAKPCVIFFDELDSVAPKRGNHGDSGGVMDRIVSQLLAELDGMSGGSGADVFVIGATNRPDLLDPALLRPGRFDRMLYLGVSETHNAQLNILEALTRKFRLDPNLSLKQLAEKCPFNYTGADFYALCSDAMLNAMSRKAEELEVKIAEMNKQRPNQLMTPQYFLAELATPDDINVFVSQTDFERALENLVPSVSQAEMEHYARVQRRFSRTASTDEEEDE